VGSDKVAIRGEVAGCELACHVRVWEMRASTARPCFRASMGRNHWILAKVEHLGLLALGGFRCPLKFVGPISGSTGLGFF
jgi:hypothetical protein